MKVFPFVVSSCYGRLSRKFCGRRAPKTQERRGNGQFRAIHNSTRAITRRAQATGRGPARVRPAPPRGAQRQPHGAAESQSGGAHSTARRQPRAPRPCVPAHRLHSCRRAETTAIFSRPRAHWLGSVVVARPCCAIHIVPLTAVARPELYPCMNNICMPRLPMSRSRIAATVAGHVAQAAIPDACART